MYVGAYKGQMRMKKGSSEGKEKMNIKMEGNKRRGGGRGIVGGRRDGGGRKRGNGGRS